MAEDEKLHALTVSIEANTKGIEKALKRLASQNTGTFGKMEKEAKKSMAGIQTALSSADRRMAGFGRSLLPSLGALTAAMSTREVIRYADAWTNAKNALAVAGVTGQKQVTVLNQLYAAAQANAAPLGALADLYGKAAQASDNLGASQADLLKFSGGVATALRVAGTSASGASGALTQLGQLLGQTRVQAEEFNSINESARPILMAVAEGLDKAGGSVSKLKALVNDGKVSGQQFFQAFLKGLPAVEAMAANATQTIEQGWVKVSNAMTRYIGETDESLGASQRLIQGLNSLADNFGATADMALNLASVIAGALVGRSIVGMLSKLALGTSALITFGRALTTVRTAGLAASFAGIGSALGPIGAAIGTIAAVTLIAFSSSSDKASASARTYAQALDFVKQKAKEAAGAIDDTTKAIDDREKNALTGGVKEGETAVNSAREAVLKLFQEIIDNAPRRLITEEQLASLQDMKNGLENGSVAAKDTENKLYSLANANPKFQKMADQLSPLLQALALAIGAVDLLKQKLGTIDGGPSQRESENASMDAYKEMKDASDKFVADAQKRNALSKDELALEVEIAKVKADAEKAGVELGDKRVKALAEENLAAQKRRSDETKSTRESDYERLTQRINEATTAQLAENAALAKSNPLVDDFGFALEKARTEADLLAAATKDGAEVTPELAAAIQETATKYASAAAAGNELADVQGRIRDEAEQMAGMLKDTFTSMVDVLYESGDIGEKLIGIFGNLGRNYANLNVKTMWEAI